MKRVGYRTGLIGKKSDYISQFTGGSRSTGYFGTGYYFCTKPERCITSTRRNHELLKLEFKDNLKWFAGSVKNHDLLKKITSFVACYDLIADKEKLDKIYWLAKYVSNTWYPDESKELFRRLGDNYNYGVEEGYYTNFDEFKKDFDNRDYVRLFEKIAEIPELAFLTDILSQDDLTSEDFEDMQNFLNDVYNDYFDFDHIEGLYSLRRHILFDVELYLDLPEEKFLNWAKEAHQYYKDHGYDQMDSISTIFLKWLGYDGVWPLDECDDTTYGGVIFEKDNIEKTTLLSDHAGDYLEHLKEEVYIAPPESLLRFWIVDENDPGYSYGYIESNRKFDFYILQKNIQKAGYKVTQIKPRYCIYARGIPSRVLISSSTYIEFTEKVLLDAARQTAMDLQTTLKPVDHSPLKDSAVKGGVFKFKHGLKESTGHKNNDDFSKSPEHLPFEKIKELLKNPEQLIKYYYQHPENYSCCQCFNVAKDLNNYNEYKEFLLGPIQHAIDTVYGITSFSKPDFPLELYRGIVLFDVEPDKDHLGICWSYEREGAEDWVNEISSDDDPNDAPCILTGKTTLDNVDWLMTILLLADTPEEREIRIWDDTKIDLLDYEVL